MSIAAHQTHSVSAHHANQDAAKNTPMSITPLGNVLGTFLAISFTLCVAFGLAFPSLVMYPAYFGMLPGVTWISWTSFALGLVETFAYGWFIALIFVPLYNFFRGQN